MEEPIDLTVTFRTLKTELGRAQKASDILCPLLTAMRAHYSAEGVLDDHLIAHVEELMANLWNALAMMAEALKDDDIPF